MSQSPAEIASVVRSAGETKEAPFCVSADIRAAHRLVKIREAELAIHLLQGLHSDTVLVNTTGTFGISSAAYWWAKLSGLIGHHAHTLDYSYDLR